MKKINKRGKNNISAVTQHGYLRRLVRQLFSTLIKRQNDSDSNAKMDLMMKMLKEMGDSIELMASEMARKSKRDN